MRLTNIDKWQIPKSQNQQKFRRAHYAITPEGTESETMMSNSELEGPEAGKKVPESEIRLGRGSYSFG